MPSPPRKSHSIAANLKTLQRLRRERVSVKDIVETVEVSGGLAPVLFILTLPVLLPLPPGFSMVLALPLLAAAPQMMLGRKQLWMPDKLGDRSMSREKLHKAIERMLPWVEKAERLVRPRLMFLTGRTGAVVCGAVCTLLAVLLVLPIPFANLLPALTVCLFSLALARRDGLALLLGFVMLGAAITGVVWGAHSARIGWHALRALF
jgi:hypothetical protein